MNKFILELNSSDTVREIVGGKAAGLKELNQAGLSTPAGYVITTHAYRTFVDHNNIERKIARSVGEARIQDPATLEKASRSIREHFQTGSMPAEILQNITSHYRQLENSGNRPVAVRSSATAEDLPQASFAGQHDTYLNVVGEEALLNAVRNCWASLWTARAIAYRAHYGIDLISPGIAVVVQHMVGGSSAGVLFTSNPYTGDRNEVIINAAWGLGEAVASGHVTPDTITVNKDTFQVKHRDVASKDIMVVSGEQSIKEIPVEDHQRLEPVLNEEQTKELARLAKVIETHFKTPQDVEWAIGDDKIHILQSRPLTRFPSKKQTLDTQAKSHEGKPVAPGDDDWPILGKWSSHPFDEWTRANVGEAFPEPLSPLVASTIPMIINGMVSFGLRGVSRKVIHEIQFAKRLYGRIYYNEGAMAHILASELGLPASIIDKTRGNTRNREQTKESRFRPLKFIRHLPVLLRFATRQRRTGRELEEFIPQLDNLISEFKKREITDLTDRELLDEAIEWFERIKKAMNLQNELSGLSMSYFGILDRMMFRWLKRRDLASDLITGLSGIQAAEMGSYLCRMAHKIRDLGLSEIILDNDPRVALDTLRQTPSAEPFIDLFDAFLDIHGHRCPNEPEWLYPRWIDAPEQVIELLTGYLRSGNDIDIEQTEANQCRRREEAVAWVEAHLGPFRKFMFRQILSRVHHATRLRDNGKNHAIKASYPARQISATVGHHWADRGWIEKAEDIFFLTLPELLTISERQDPSALRHDLPHLVNERRKAYDFWFKVDPPLIIGPDEQPLTINSGETSDSLLQGISACSGRVRGVARVLFNPQEAMKMRPDEILVTRSTDAGWSTVFPLISGLITEIGGQLSHAAILAREYGLPTVVDVKNATSVIQDGQTITIDAAKGRIYLEF